MTDFPEYEPYNRRNVVKFRVQSLIWRKVLDKKMRLQLFALEATKHPIEDRKDLEKLRTFIRTIVRNLSAQVSFRRAMYRRRTTWR